MKLVIIESPYCGKVRRNEAYLDRCIVDSLMRGEAPFASHGFYTKYLDDKTPKHRRLGMACGFNWAEKADLIAVYDDYGITDGMRDGIKRHESLGIPVEYRSIMRKKNNWHGVDVPQGELDEVMLAAQQFYDVTRQEIISKRREERLLLARKNVASVLKMRGYGYAAIGRAMDRDHTSIIHMLDYEFKDRRLARGRRKYEEKARQAS